MLDRICDNCMSRVPADSEKCPRCGIRFENTNPGGALPNGWVLAGRYTVGRYMEIDGEGAKYAAIDGNTLQRVVIKEFMPLTLCATRDDTGAIVPKPGNEVLFKTTRMDYRDMYTSLMRLGLTEGLVQVLDVIEENNTVYAVMEQIEGPSLSEYLAKNSLPMEATRVQALLRPIMMGVDAMHNQNLVHRGISPDNIVLESGGTAKLIGFGTLALRQQGSELKPKLYPGYSAPEQYAANEFEGRYTDVYALGAVFYRLLTGEAPQSADERKIQDNMRQARQMNKEVPNYISAAVARALRLASSERLQSMSELRLALSGEATKDTRGHSSNAGGGLQPKLIAAIVAGAVVLLIIIIVLVNVLRGGSNGASTSIDTSVPTSIASVNENTTPDFVGRTLVYVQQNYSSQYPFIVEEEFSSAVTEGVIMSQTPTANTAYNGETITLVVSKGEDPAASTAEMPDFVKDKTTLAAARTTLLNMGVDESNITVVTETNDGTHQENDILRTSPEAGTSFSVGSDKIIIYVAGEMPVQMPSLVGMTWESAVAALEKLGLSYSQAVWVDNLAGEYTPGRVVYAGYANGTEIEAGTYVQSGTTITVYVASEYGLPDLVGMTEADARSTLSRLSSATGISITVNVEYVEGTGTPGTVITMDPTAKNQFSSSITVTLRVVAEPSN